MKANLQKNGKLLLCSILVTSSALTSSCGLRELTSEAYKFGKETGSQWRDLANEFEVFSTWIKDGTGEELTIPEVQKESACRAMWIAVGWPKFGLKNMTGNRTDFIDGCLTTIGD